MKAFVISLIGYKIYTDRQFILKTRYYSGYQNVLVDHVLLCFQMMQNLLLEEGGLVQVESVNLMVATYSKFQPQSPDFLDITNPKAVYANLTFLTSQQLISRSQCAIFRFLFSRLENALRNFACLTTGDVIAINYNEKVTDCYSV